MKVLICLCFQFCWLSINTSFISVLDFTDLVGILIHNSDSLVLLTLFNLFRICQELFSNLTLSKNTKISQFFIILKNPIQGNNVGCEIPIFIMKKKRTDYINLILIILT